MTEDPAMHLHHDERLRGDQAVAGSGIHDRAAWTAPRTWVANEVLTSTLMNTHLRDELIFLHDRGADLVSAATITPTSGFHRVTGATTITAITSPTGAGQGGNRLLLQFVSAGCTITAGATLVLTNGPFTSAANSFILFVWDDAATAWTEISRSGGSGTMLKKTATKIVSGLGETDLFNGEFTVGGGVLGPNGILEIQAEGDWVWGTSATQTGMPRYRLKFGGVTLIDTGTGNTGGTVAATARWPWRLTVSIRNKGATNVQSISFLMHASADGALNTWATTFVAGEGKWFFANLASVGIGYASAAVDTTLNQPLVFTVDQPQSVNETDLTGAHVRIS